jgi:hypothetical protein
MRAPPKVVTMSASEALIQARRVGFIAGWKEEVRDLERAQQAKAVVALIDDWQAAQPLLFEELHGVIDRRIRAHGNHVRLHHILNARRKIVDQLRRRDAEFLEDEIDPLIGVARARGEDVLLSAKTFQFGVADR